jgi:hypothetical protein
MVKTLIENNLKSRGWNLIDDMSQFATDYRVYGKKDFIIVFDYYSENENVVVYAFDNNKRENNAIKITDWISYDDMDSNFLKKYLMLNY